MTDEVSIKLKIPKFSISKSKKLIIVLQELQKRSQKSAEWNARTKANKEKMRLASLMGDKEELEQDEEMMEEAEPSPERDEEGGWQLTRQEWINMKEDVTNMKKMIENFMQLDLGHLRINNAFSWHGCREEDFSVVHLDVLHAEILGINLAVGINGSVGNPVIREGREVHVYVRRSLRDVFRKIPTFSLEVKVGLTLSNLPVIRRHTNGEGIQNTLQYIVEVAMVLHMFVVGLEVDPRIYSSSCISPRPKWPTRGSSRRS